MKGRKIIAREITMTHKLIICTIATTMFCLMAMTRGAEHPLGLDINFAYGILGDGYESRHVKWANPYAGGRIRTLVLAPEWSQRETIELAQRLDLDYTSWMPSAFSHLAIPAPWYWYATPGALMDQLLREYIAADHDVIVIGKLQWSMLPAKQRFDLLKKVSEGTGLVYICPPAQNTEIELVFSRTSAPAGVAFISRAIPFAALPQLKDLSVQEIVRAGMFGKGRVVALDYGQEMPAEQNSRGDATAAAAYPALTPQWDTPAAEEISAGYIAPDDCPEAEFVPYEYYHSLVARAVVWASAADAPASLTSLTLPAILDYPASAYTALLNAESAAAGAVLQATVRHRYEYDRTYEIPVQPAADENTVTLPAVPAGEYFLDVWLLDSDGKVCDWSSRFFRVVSDITVAGISMDGRNHNAGDSISGSVKLSRALAADELLLIELWDNHGRKIDEKQTADDGTEHVFALALGRPLTVLHHIRARVRRENKDVSMARLNFPVRAKLKQFDDFNEIVWSSAENQFLTHLMLRKLAEEDQADVIDVGWRGATHARNIAAANLTALPYTAGFGHFKSKIQPVTGMMNGCMTAPQTFAAIDKWGALQSDIYGPYGPVSWTHGDESYYADNPDTCWSETCLAHFREQLKEKYADLAWLNREWNTEYENWDEVLPLTFEDALETGNYAPWVEHRLAQQLVWAKLYAHTGRALSLNDPGAHVGFDGNNGFNLPNGGINWWVIKDYMGALHSYMRNSEEMEIFRSFAGPGHLSGMWYGTYGPTWQIGPSTVEYHHFFPWYSVFHGLNSTWFWSMGAPGPRTGYAPDFTNMPFMQASRNALAEIRTGIGKLLLAGQLQHDGIAIHYSEVSRLVDSIISGKTDDRLEGDITIDLKRPVTTAWAQGLTDFNKAFEHSGFQYRYLAYEEIADDALEKLAYRVFIMPQSRAVSEKEAAAIRAFVHDGGLVIADIMPGILNGHGTRQEKSMLADLFPSRRPGTVNRIGKGKTVLLGDQLKGYGYSSYSNMQGWVKLEGRHSILSDIIAKETGIKPQVTVSHREEGDMPPTEVFRIKSGEAEYVGLLREYFMYDHDPYAATVTFSRRSHLYDMRAGEYLGFTNQVKTVISHQAQLYALLPYRVSALLITGPELAGRGDDSEYSLVVRAGWLTQPGSHVLRVEVLNSTGRQLPWYAANVMAENGRGTHTISWALNDPSGNYTLQVRDIASNVISRKKVRLR